MNRKFNLLLILLLTMAACDSESMMSPMALLRSCKTPDASIHATSRFNPHLSQFNLLFQSFNNNTFARR